MPLAQSTKTGNNIAAAVKRQFGDESGVQINNSDILRWINQAQEEIVRQGDVNKTMVTTPSVAGQAAYSFAGQPIVKVLGVFYKGAPISNLSFEQAQETILQNPDVGTLGGIPTAWYEFDDSLYLHPAPAAADEEIKLYIVKAATALSSLSDTLSVPDTHYEAVLQYCLQQAYELDEDFGLSAVKGEQFRESMGNLMNTSSEKFYPTITILPEDMEW